MGQPVLSQIHVSQKKQIKHKLLMEVDKELFSGQYSSDCIIFFKIDENFVKGKHRLNHIIFYDFFAV